MSQKEEKIAEVVVDFFNALEAACVNAKRQIVELKGIGEEKPKWDPSKIKWVQAEGSKGSYERSEDVDSLDYKELLKDLEAHNGKLSRDGFFYWKFEKSAVVGRKLRRK
jgi:hypothetical protein